MATPRVARPPAADARPRVAARASVPARSLRRARRGGGPRGDRVLRRARGAARPSIAPYDPLATSWTRDPQGAERRALVRHRRDRPRRAVARDLRRARVAARGRGRRCSSRCRSACRSACSRATRAARIDMLISRLTDAVLACPFLILAIALAAFLGPSLTNAMIAIGVSATPVFVRLTRGQTLAIKAEEFVSRRARSAIRRGASRSRHVLPNVVPALIVQATLAIAAAVIAEASLSFLGLGQQPPAPSWGSMLNTREELHRQRAVDGGLAGRVDLRARAVVQPRRRRPARRARSAARLTNRINPAAPCRRNGADRVSSRSRRTRASRRARRCQAWPKQMRPRPRRHQLLASQMDLGLAVDGDVRAVRALIDRARILSRPALDARVHPGGHLVGR